MSDPLRYDAVSMARTPHQSKHHMNNNLTEIAYILDRSGSMAPMVEPAIAGFNQFLRDQREAPGEARLWTAAP